MTSHALGRALREARHEAGLQQTETVTQVGKSQSWLSKVECGDHALLTSDLARLATTYGTTVQAIWTSAEQMETKDG